MANTKPFVAAAFFCESLLEEEGGVVSVVRIIDTYSVGVFPKTEGSVAVIAVNGLIALKSGDVTGRHVVSLVLENTQGIKTVLSPEGGWPVDFLGGEHGVQLKLKFPLGVKNYGLCWFDVLFDGEALTRIPLRLRPIEESPITTTEPS